MRREKCRAESIGYDRLPRNGRTSNHDFGGFLFRVHGPEALDVGALCPHLP
jgi:hypothetical protein